MSDAPGNGATLAYRVGEAESDIRDLRKEKAATRDVDALSKVVGDFIDEVKSLRRTIMAFAFTVAGAGVAIAAAVLLAGGKPS